MKHIQFKIRPEFLELVKSGKKKHEYRLCIGERASISYGDRILLISNDNDKDNITVNVNEVKKYDCWEKALNDNWTCDFDEKCSSIDDVLRICYKFYRRDQINEFGIIRYGINKIQRELKHARVLLDTNIIIQREGYTNASYEVNTVYKWLSDLECTMFIHPDTINEILKYKDEQTKENFKKKFNFYELLPSHDIKDGYFEKVVANYSKDPNSQVDNRILYQVYDGVVDILITDDRKILKKARQLGIRPFVLSTEEYLRIVEKEYPDLIDYEILAIRQELIGNIDLDNKFFDSLKEDYQPGFTKWFNKKSQKKAYTFRTGERLDGFLLLKIEDEDEKGYLEIEPPLSRKKRLKIATFKISEEATGFRLGERFLKIIFDNALKNKAQEIYVTFFEGTRPEVDRLGELFKKWGFVKHGFKNWDDGRKESVYVKTLENYDPSKSVIENYPLVSKEPSLYFLPIEPQYHTPLFPDSILKTENKNLYSGNKGHLYSLEKIYVSNSFGGTAKPGDLLIIYRKGDRYPKKYSSVCTGVAVFEEINKPQDKEKYLNICSNKSVFTEEELNRFYDENNYRSVVKLIPYKTYFEKISLQKLYDEGIIIEGGPRPFEKIPNKYRNLFMKGEAEDEEDEEYYYLD